MTAFRRLRVQRFASGFGARFARAERGTTAVEFALIAIPFFVLIFGLMEVTMVFLVTTTLESATEAASRTIRTGEFQTSGSHSKADFKAAVCAKMSWLATACSTDMFVDVRTFSNFAALSSNTPVAGSSFDPTTTCFTAGAPSDIVLVRAYYRWHLFTPLLNNALQNMGSGSGMRLISSATAFRNEPYNEDAPVGAGC